MYPCSVDFLPVIAVRAINKEHPIIKSFNCYKIASLILNIYGLSSFDFFLFAVKVYLLEVFAVFNKTN